MSTTGSVREGHSSQLHSHPLQLQYNRVIIFGQRAGEKVRGKTERGRKAAIEEWRVEAEGKERQGKEEERVERRGSNGERGEAIGKGRNLKERGLSHFSIFNHNKKVLCKYVHDTAYTCRGPNYQLTVVF